MSHLTAPPEEAGHLWPFFLQEYLRILRSRLARWMWVLLVYALVTVPFLLQRPPLELTQFLSAWLGPQHLAAKLFLFVWVDASLNKFAVVLGPALAGGILVEERARGTLDLFVSKPVRGGDYFTVKLAAAGAVGLTFYLGCLVGGLLTFPWRVPYFPAVDFLAVSAVHVFAALFAVTASGTIAVHCERRLTGVLVSFALLGTLVGFAFLGFYYPAWRTLSAFNPFFQGIALIGSLEHYGLGDLLQPIGILIAFNLGVALIGRQRAVRLLEG